MPIYEYQCQKCKKQFEVVTMSMSEKPNAVCPKCKSKKISKVMSKFGRGKYASLSSGSSAELVPPAVPAARHAPHRIVRPAGIKFTE